MKKLFLAVLMVCMLMSALSVSAFAYTTGGSVEFTALGSTTSQVTVTDQQDFDNWYADFLANGSDETRIALFINGSVIFTEHYDLSKFYLSISEDVIINEEATVICQALQFSSCCLTNNGTLIITGENQYNTKMSVGFFNTSKDIFTNNGTLIFRKGNQVEVLKNADPSVVTFINNGTIYTEDGTLTNRSYNPAVITNGTGTIRQMNTLTAENGSATGNVKASYATAQASETVYSVDIAWGSMEFTYTEGSAGTWNPETHDYDGATTGAWSCTAEANKITVTNHSNAAVDATLSYTKEDAYSAIDGSFTNASGSAIGSTLQLATADGTALASAPTANAFLKLDGALSSGVTNTKIGTVTVTITNHAGVGAGEGSLID